MENKPDGMTVVTDIIFEELPSLGQTYAATLAVMSRQAYTAGFFGAESQKNIHAALFSTIPALQAFTRYFTRVYWRLSLVSVTPDDLNERLLDIYRNAHSMGNCPGSKVLGDLDDLMIQARSRLKQFPGLGLLLLMLLFNEKFEASA